MKQHTFRGHDIDEHGDGTCIIHKDGQVLASQPQHAAAMKWIHERIPAQRKRQ